MIEGGKRLPACDLTSKELWHTMKTFPFRVPHFLEGDVSGIQHFLGNQGNDVDAIK